MAGGVVIYRKTSLAGLPHGQELGDGIGKEVVLFARSLVQGFVLTGNWGGGLTAGDRDLRVVGGKEGGAIVGEKGGGVC